MFLCRALFMCGLGKPPGAAVSWTRALAQKPRGHVFSPSGGIRHLPCRLLADIGDSTSAMKRNVAHNNCTPTLLLLLLHRSKKRKQTVVVTYSHFTKRVLPITY